MWSCRGTLRFVTSAPRLRFAFGKASAVVTLVRRLKCSEVLPPPIPLPLPSWFSSRCSITATPIPPLPTPSAGTLLLPTLRSNIGRYTKTRLDWARPPAHLYCRFGTPSGHLAPESPPYTVLSCHWSPFCPPAPLSRAGPYFHFLALADTRQLSDIIFLCQGFIHFFCSPYGFRRCH